MLLFLPLLIFIIPRQRVAEAIMFLTKSVRQSCFSCQHNFSVTAHRISWNVVVMKEIMCRCAYPQEIWFIFFSRSNGAIFELRNLANWKILLNQFVSATPLKPLHRISWKFVVIKDIVCTYAFLQEMLIWSFEGALYILRKPGGARKEKKYLVAAT